MRVALRMPVRKDGMRGGWDGEQRVRVECSKVFPRRSDSRLLDCRTEVQAHARRRWRCPSPGVHARSDHSECSLHLAISFHGTTDSTDADACERLFDLRCRVLQGRGRGYGRGRGRVEVEVKTGACNSNDTAGMEHAYTSPVRYLVNRGHQPCSIYPHIGKRLQGPTSPRALCDVPRSLPESR